MARELRGRFRTLKYERPHVHRLFLVAPSQRQYTCLVTISKVYAKNIMDFCFTWLESR